MEKADTPKELTPVLRPVHWVGSSLDAVREMPEDVKDEIGKVLLAAQQGLRHKKSVVLQGFQGASVLEIKDDYDTNTYRCVYTVRFSEAIYVVHAFQKKSTTQNKTSQRDMELIKDRLREAEDDYKQRYGVQPVENEKTSLAQAKSKKGSNHGSA